MATLRLNDDYENHIDVLKGRRSLSEGAVIRRLYTDVILNGDQICLLELSRSITPAERKLFAGQEGKIKGLRMFINKHTGVFKVSRDGAKGRELVRPVIDIEFCKVFDSKQGCNDFDCPNLHICRHFVKGKCTFGVKCKKPHHFDDPHTMSILRKHYLDGLSRCQLKEFLCRNVQFAIEESVNETNLPKQLEICKYYNVAIGCSREGLCPFLHVCRFFAEDGTCKFGQKCLRKHDCCDGHAQLLLKRYNIKDTEVFAYLRDRGVQGKHTFSPDDKSTYLNQNNISPKLRRKGAVTLGASLLANEFKNWNCIDEKGHQASFENFICEKAFTGHCIAESCKKIHKPLPFCWQYTLDQRIWIDVERKENVKIEAVFVRQEQDCVDVNINGTHRFLFKFSDGVGILKKHASSTFLGEPPPLAILIRRLSTSPSIGNHNGTPDFNTRWTWYFLNNMGIWQAYDDLQLSKNETMGEVDSLSIETAYSLQENGHFQFKQEGCIHVINFNSMCEENISTGKQTPVRRRPSNFDVHILTKRHNKHAELEKSFFPCYWKTEALLGIPGGDFGQYELLELDPYSMEYLKTFSHYGKSMGYEHVTKILAVQNPRLWMTYTMKRDELKEKRSGKVEEISLYRAVLLQEAERVCTYGFDNDFEHGIKKEFFAKDPRMANLWHISNHAGVFAMFVCRVLSDSCVAKKLSMSDVIREIPFNSFDLTVYHVTELDHVYPEFIVLSCSEKSMYR